MESNQSSLLLITTDIPQVWSSSIKTVLCFPADSKVDGVTNTSKSYKRKAYLSCNLVATAVDIQQPSKLRHNRGVIFNKESGFEETTKTIKLIPIVRGISGLKKFK